MLTGTHELNVLFALALLTVVVGGLQGGPLQRVGALVLMVVGGVAVEYLWVAPLLGVAVWCYVRHPSGVSVLLGLVALALLSVINGNHWAWLVIPLLVVAVHRPVHCALPRWRNLFYVYYPAHLALLWVLQSSYAPAVDLAATAIRCTVVFSRSNTSPAFNQGVVLHNWRRHKAPSA